MSATKKQTRSNLSGIQTKMGSNQNGIQSTNRGKAVPPYDFRNQSKTPEPGRLLENGTTKLASYQTQRETDEDEDDTWDLDSDAAEKTMAALRGGDGKGGEAGGSDVQQNAVTNNIKASDGGGGDAVNGGKPTLNGIIKTRRNSQGEAGGDAGKVNGKNQSSNLNSSLKKLPNGSAGGQSTPAPKSPFSNFTVAVSEEEGSSSDDDLEKPNQRNSSAKGRGDRGHKGKEGEDEKKSKKKRPLSAKLERAAKTTAASARRSIERTFRTNSRDRDVEKQDDGGKEEQEQVENVEVGVAAEIRQKSIDRTCKASNDEEDHDDGDDDDVRIHSCNKTLRPSRSSSIKKSLVSSLLPTSTSFRLLSDPLADEKLLLETHHTQHFLQTPSLDLDDMGGVHALAARGERRIRHLTHAGCGVVRIGITFPAVFILTCLQCLVKYVLHPIFVGVAELVVDSMVKPFVVVVFNKVFSPVLLLLFNGLTALRVALKPAFEIVREVAQIVARILGSFRLVEINYGENKRDREVRRNEPSELQEI